MKFPNYSKLQIRRNYSKTTNCYQRNYCPVCLQQFIREFNSFQTILLIYRQFITGNSANATNRKFIPDNEFRFQTMH